MLVSVRALVPVCSWAIAVSLLAACSSSDAGNPVAAHPDSGAVASRAGDAAPAPDLDFSAWDAAVEAFLADNDLSGASAVVVHRDYGIVHLQGYGDFDPDRIYLIASSSKIVSVGILMRLTDQGLLDIDAPISDFVDWSSDKGDLTVAELVSNSSGLPSLTDNPTYGPYLCQYVDTGTLTDCAHTIFTADDAADRIPPDTEFHYGGGPWQLAGGIAEVVSGKTWDELVQEAYVEPCGAGTLGYTNQFARAAAEGGNGVASALSYPGFFQGDPANAPETDNPSIEGGAYVDAEDYGKILLMHLREGRCGDARVLEAESVARMQQDRIQKAYNGTTSNANLQGYGLGWWVDRDNEGVVADPGAYGAIPWLDVARGYGAFVLLEANAGFGGNLFVETKPLLDAVFDDAQ